MAVALSFGRLCKTCIPGQCRARPCAEYQPLLACVSCNGKRCAACGFRGEFPVTECPHRIVTPASWEILRIANLMEKGILPAPGASLDQSKPLMDAVEFVWGDEAASRQEMIRQQLKK